MTCITFDLPFPPSVNNLFSQNRHGRRFPSSRYTKWRTEAGMEIRLKRIKPIEKPITRIVLDLYPPDRRKRDADNCAKAVHDLLVEMRVIKADDMSALPETTQRFVAIDNPSRVTVQIHTAD